MPLSPADLSILSRLLDEAQELAPGQLEAWLSALPASHAHLQPALREMLADAPSRRLHGFLSEGPRLAGDAADRSVAHAGERIGAYRLVREIGHGGMGTVWLAERVDGSLSRTVALKLPRMAWDGGLAERMARERDIGALLEHPNIARLYDAGLDAQGRPFLALEYVDGQPLDVWCEAKGLSVPERLRLIVQVARAVAYAHGRLVVHRDLKPSNVLVSADGQTRLLDFGIAKLLHDAVPGEIGLTQAQGRVMTLHYASPEQMQGATITVHSDVYSLGALAFAVLTGKTPYETKRAGVGALEAAMLEGEPAPASSRVHDPATRRALRGEVDSILARALRREPAERYPTADAFADDIDRHLAGERVLAQPDSVWYRTRKTLRRHRVVFSAAAAVLIVAVLGAGVTVVQAERAARSAERQRLVTDFVADVFRINYRPDAKSGPTADLAGERLLQEGGKLIAQRFPGEPALQANLYGVVERLFLDMGAADQAVDYGTRQIEALDLAGASPAERGKALLALSQGLLERGRLADAEARARRAVELSKGDLAQEADALAMLARALSSQGKHREALDVADKLAEASQRIGHETAAEAWGYGVRASALSGLNRFAESMPLRERGIAIALRVEGELSPAAINIRLETASSLIGYGEVRQAKPISEAALRAMRQRGGPNAIAAAARTANYWRHFAGAGVVTYDEAIATIEAAQAFLAGQPSAPEYIRKRADFERGTLELVRGNIKEAQRWIPGNAEAMIQSTDSPYEHFASVAQVARLQMNAGEHGRAEASLLERARLRVLLGAGQHPFRVYDYTSRAANLSMAGRYDEALEVLDEAPRPADSADDRPSRTARDSIVKMRARVLADRGDFAAAWHLVEGFELSRPQYNNYGYALAGELQCALGRAPEGVRLFEVLLGSTAFANEYENSPLLAWTRGNAGVCALATGDRAAAQRYADQARAAFAAQPEVSPYFKRPLARLESALAKSTRP